MGRSCAMTAAPTMSVVLPQWTFCVTGQRRGRKWSHIPIMCVRFGSAKDRQACKIESVRCHIEYQQARI